MQGNYNGRSNKFPSIFDENRRQPPRACLCFHIKPLHLHRLFTKWTSLSTRPTSRISRVRASLDIRNIRLLNNRTSFSAMPHSHKRALIIPIDLPSATARQIIISIVLLVEKDPKGFQAFRVSYYETIFRHVWRDGDPALGQLCRAPRSTSNLPRSQQRSFLPPPVP